MNELYVQHFKYVEYGIYKHVLRMRNRCAHDVHYNKVTLFEIGWLYVRVDREAHAFVSVSVLITEMRVIITNAVFMLFMLLMQKNI